MVSRHLFWIILIEKWILTATSVAVTSQSSQMVLSYNINRKMASLFSRSMILRMSSFRDITLESLWSIFDSFVPHHKMGHISISAVTKIRPDFPCHVTKIWTVIVRLRLHAFTFCSYSDHVDIREGYFHLLLKDYIIFYLKYWTILIFCVVVAHPKGKWNPLYNTLYEVIQKLNYSNILIRELTYKSQWMWLHNNHKWWQLQLRKRVIS